MKTNDLKQGDWIKLKNGWVGQLADNRRGNVRTATVYGWHTEVGSVYSHDIVAKLDAGPRGGRVVAKVEHTAGQKKLERIARGLGWQ